VKVIIPLAGYGTRMRPLSWSRAKPLLNVAGDTIIGHLLNMMSPITTDEVYFVVGHKGDELEAWIRQNHPHLNAHFVLQEEALGQAHALWMCQDIMDEDELLVAFGDGIVDADYESISDTDADAVCLVQEVEDPRTFGVAVVADDGSITDFIEKPKVMDHRMAIAGIYWFRHGRLLRQALEIVIREGRKTKGEYYLVDAYQVLLEQGTRIVAKPTIFWLDAGKPNYILSANARLLSLGYGSEDALERSYSEDFTVLPPVFIHESAKVIASVIGPYVNIEAGVTIQNSIVRNSIIDGGTTIEECILDGALIGENCRVVGQRSKLFIGDDSILEPS
jgi:glucose-1-phosphate thymidylyltransferase